MDRAWRERYIRPSRERSFNELVPEKEPAHIKLGVVARLKREVGYSQNNKKLATMIADFAQVTNKSTGRTVTKVCDKPLPAPHTIFLSFIGRFCILGRSIGTPHSLTVIVFSLMYGHFTKLEVEGPPVSTSTSVCSLEYFVGVRRRESPIKAFPIKCKFWFAGSPSPSYRLWRQRMTRSSSRSSSRASTPSPIYLSRTFSLLYRNFTCSFSLQQL